MSVGSACIPRHAPHRRQTRQEPLRFLPVTRAMAKVSLNATVQRISGQVDEYVYKTVNGKSFLTKKPVFRGRKWSREQRVAQTRLQAAAGYASAVWKVPEQKAFYEALRKKRKAWRAYSLATADFLNPPTIESVELLSLEQPNTARLRVDARDDAAVVKVTVSVKSSTGAVLLEGAALPTADGFWDLDAENWPAATDFAIEVAAEDQPGNRTVKVYAAADVRRQRRVAR